MARDVIRPVPVRSRSAEPAGAARFAQPPRPGRTAPGALAPAVGCLALAVVVAIATPAAAQTTVELMAARDTTIFQEGDLANGAGSYLFTGPNDNGSERRALLAFDIAGSVPSGATVTSAELDLQMNRTISGEQTIGLHRLNAGWGEAGSDATGQEGRGASAQSGDATWQHRFFPDDAWSAPGGDFAAAASAEQQVSGSGTYTWGSTGQMVTDVQGWLDNPASNHGWILVMSSSGTAKRFASREGTSGAPVLRVTYTMEQTDLDTFYFVAAAAKAEGDEGAFFVTDLDIVNRGGGSATYRALWLPRGEDNSMPTMSSELTLGPGEAVRHADVLGSLFGLSDGAIGAVAVMADSEDLVLMSRTFNQPGTAGSGTFGQSIPGQRADRLIQAGERLRIAFFTENDDFRSNLGLLNGTDSSITIMRERFTADGSSLGVDSVTLPPWGNTQLNRLFSDSSPVEAASVDVWTDTTGGAFAAYGSVLDNVSSDPTTVLPQ